MTAALISRAKGRRAAAAIGAVSLGLLTLSACEKPTELATVTVGSTTLTSEAIPGCDGNGEALSQKQIASCVSQEGGKSVEVHAGEKVRIGVDPAVAKAGWYVVAGDPVLRAPSNDTYRTFDADKLFQRTNPQTGQVSYLKEVTLLIGKLAKGQGQGTETMWHFQLKAKD
ncbi:hypothetical protein [Streptomyces gilvosporeus]|uniref:DUF2771 domain-containing protein n=1 Tax=Streptomyces gilvosporeus TaxID=553510 RepID=A0A1V0TVF1_9ACTN|nr:hypothetical protein [Streptomyces gilvosporeus]ARF56935.1 hypothetical protein B1H19_24650 [Streptomyces gilvosporeus]